MNRFRRPSRSTSCAARKRTMACPTVRRTVSIPPPCATDCKDSSIALDAASTRSGGSPPMPQRVVPRATPLGHPVDLGASWNADADAVASVLHPQYGTALARVPEGPSVFRGLPFDLGPGAGRRWILLDDPDRPVSIELGPGVPAGASHLVIAHFSDSWREPGGGRPAGEPVGWGAPARGKLAAFEPGFAARGPTHLR